MIKVPEGERTMRKALYETHILSIYTNLWKGGGKRREDESGTINIKRNLFCASSKAIMYTYLPTSAFTKFDGIKYVGTVYTIKLRHRSFPRKVR
jgi:hypothetical protein